MAKKKKKVHRRRRRVSGITARLQSAVLDVAAAGAGGLLSAFANQAVKTSMPNSPKWIGGAASALAGGLIIVFAKPSPMIDSFATGLIAGGTLFAVNETFLSIPGISGIPPGMPMPGRGYINNTVAGSRMPNGIGTLSGANSAVLAGIMDN